MARAHLVEEGDRFGAHQRGIELRRRLLAQEQEEGAFGGGAAAGERAGDAVDAQRFEAIGLLGQLARELERFDERAQAGDDLFVLAEVDLVARAGGQPTATAPRPRRRRPERRRRERRRRARRRALPRAKAGARRRS